MGIDFSKMNEARERRLAEEKLLATTMCYTGHRPNKFVFGFNEKDEQCKLLKRNLSYATLEAYEAGYRKFITGMAIGVDQWAAEIVITLRDVIQLPDIKLIAAVPCKGQENVWPKISQERFQTILSKCNEVNILAEAYDNKVMEQRNRWMVDHSSRVQGVWDHSVGGTSSCIEYAHRRNKFVRVIDPNFLKDISMDNINTLINKIRSQMDAYEEDGHEEA